MTLRQLRLILPLLACAAFLPSCAYMQTNKNIREMGRSYPGYKLDKPRQLFRSGGVWYVSATPAEYSLSHDFVHDNVFRESNEPTMKLRGEIADTPAYHAISADTATVLLREDGYADNRTIAKEIAESTAPWVTSLPNMSAHIVRAQVVGEESAAITMAPQPAEVPLAYRVLGGLDFLLVDVPGTVVYNVAVPFIAPFVFFHEFLAEQ